MTLGLFARYLLSAVFAAVVAALAVSVLGLSLEAAPLALLVALPHALLLGLPLALLARRTGWVAWPVAVAGGALVGALPLAILALLAPTADQVSTGDVPTIVNHVRTATGWLEYLQGAMMLAGLGAVGGLGFQLALFVQGGPGLTPDQNAWPERRGPPWLAGLMICAAVAAIAAVPALTADRSCHNPLRDGGRSIGAVASVDVMIPVRDWGDLRRLFRNFATERRWSFREDIRHQRGLDTLYLSVCTKDGAQIEALQQVWGGRGSPPDRGVPITVYQPQGGGSWQAPSGLLINQIGARWPGQLQFRGAQGQPVDAPPWVRLTRPPTDPRAYPTSHLH